MKYIGNFESYNSGEGDLVFSGTKGNLNNLKNYEPALLNELWNDAEGQADIGYSGFRTTFEEVGGYIQAWSQGQQTYFKSLVRDVDNLGEGNLDKQ